MLAVYLSPLYILVNVYIFWRLIQWLSACHGLFGKRPVRVAAGLVYLFFATSLLVGFFLPAGSLQRFFKSAGNYWLGVLLYAVLVLACAELVRLAVWLRRRRGRRGETPEEESPEDRSVVRRRRAIAGGAAALLVTALSLWGVVNARIIHTTKYQVTVDKSAGELGDLRVVLTADLHLGYNIGCRQMEDMVEKINGEDPDLVVIAGDIFDNEYEALEDPDRLAEILGSISARYGVYACYGNHDIQEKILAGFTFGSKDGKKESDPRMDAFLERAGITLLQDEGVLVDDSFYLFGRADAGKPGRGITVRKTPEEITADMDQTKPVLVMDHEPEELQELADAGVDVDLGGHTHDGQMFPGNIVMKFLWENPCGYLKKDQMHSIVTSGAGLFGPNMRVGTKAEICVVDIHFAGE